ncbi:MAG TPA: ATP-binding protein [Candidatus Competibacter sp.]|nr:response regulator [Candidatus Competibacteraceae bacterium]HRW64715.1 ATP-binding protein [Candidatus Competibacter sp.]
MTPSRQNAEHAAQKHPLHRRLLFSHLSVALVGVGMLLVALVSTYELRARVILLVNEGVPLAQASAQMLAGVQHSLASLRGWVSLGDPQFLVGWRAAWQQEIQPAVERIKQCGHLLAGRSCVPERLRELQTLLADLQESQWWVQEVARAPGNEPARMTYLFNVEPSVRELASIMAALLAFEETTRESDDGRKPLLVRLMEIQGALAGSHLLLRETLGPNGLHYTERLERQLGTTQALVTQATADPLLTLEQGRLLRLFQREWQAFITFARKIVRQRQAMDWNIALHRLAAETDPMANRTIALATTMAADAKIRLEQEADAARAASAITVWNLAIMILVMLAVAYGMSRKHARDLTLPIAALAEATRKLATGNPSDNIIASGNDELTELTRSFNTMRASMQQAQTVLREAYAKLEQRVMERTAQLETTNDSLIKEIAVRNQTEAALRESEARLRAMTRAMPDLVFVVDEDGRYREVLAAGRDIGATLMRGKVPAPIRGKLLSEVHPPEMAALFLDIILRALRTQQIQIAEYELETSSGPRWFESRTAPLDVQFTDRSTIPANTAQQHLFPPPEVQIVAKSAAIVVARDITKRKQAEVQLRQAQKMHAIGQLTGGIAHDFNNLLAVIMGNLELLHEQLAAQPRLHELAQQALRAVDRGANLTRRLLAFARRQPLLAQPTDLNKLILGMLDLMRRTLGANIQIDTMLAADLKQTLVDPDQLESALLNLAINARDAMPRGGKLALETGNVRLDENYASTQQEDVRPGLYVMLAVRDNGGGMVPEVLEHAFEPFFTTKETSKGSGLGLSMVYGLVKQSGGHIAIHSKPGQGTTVRLYLPQMQASPSPPTGVKAADTVFKGHGETILVVEDDTDVRLFAVNALRALGYDTRQAGDAAAALELLETTPQIALLFTDIVLPGEMDGVKLAAEAQHRHPGLRVLFTSGYTEHPLIVGGQLAEDVEILAKPYRKNELGQKLRVLLGRGESV